MIMVFKIKNDIVPDYVKRNIEYVESDRYPLRNIGKFNLARYNKSSTQRNLTNLNEFKKSLTVHIKQNMFVII